jgi:hypothetical protein
MRDIRGDLQDRAAHLEEQISAQETQFEQLVEQLKREHDTRLEDFRAELDAVNRLMELELRRIETAPVSQMPQAQEPAAPAVHQPYQHHQPQPQVLHHVQAPAQPQVPHHLQAQAPMPPQPQVPPHIQAQVAQMQPQPQVPPHAQAQAQPQAQAQQRQPQMPLADFLIRKVNEAGAMPRDDLRRFALQEGYFLDVETADRGVHATLINVVKAGLIRQLPNGNFAPASVLDTIRLRRAM